MQRADDWHVGVFLSQNESFRNLGMKGSSTFHHFGHLIDPESRGLQGGLIGCSANVLGSWLQAGTKLKYCFLYKLMLPLSVNQKIYDFSFHLQGFSGTYAN